MAKFVADSVLDAALNKIATATRWSVCSAQPANYAGIAAVTLLAVTVTGADYTLAADTSGRKVTMAAKTGLAVTANGDATHVALDDGVTLLYVTTCTLQTLAVGNTVSLPSWKINIQGPT